jgi:hypothetical protein
MPCPRGSGCLGNGQDCGGKSIHFSPGWVKDARFSNAKKVEALIWEATTCVNGGGKLLKGWQELDLICNAGPHVKAGTGAGNWGDSRPHITVRRAGGGGMHIILDKTWQTPIRVEE